MGSLRVLAKRVSKMKRVLTVRIVGMSVVGVERGWDG